MTDIGPGTRVECIDTNYLFPFSGTQMPQLGGVYTVMDCFGFGEHAHIAIQGWPGLWFLHYHFRPIGGESPGMEMICKALRDVDTPEKVDA